MTFNPLALLDPAWMIGGGTGVLGFIGGHIKTRSRRVDKLEQEVKECRERDADVIVLMAGVRVLVGKVQREHPESSELAMFQNLLNRRLGPPPTTDQGFADLLRQIDRRDQSHE